MPSKFFKALGALVLLSQTGHAVITPQTTLTHDSVNGTYTLSWYGSAGHTYFIHHSLDLMTWQTMPIIESGANANLSWTIQLNADRTFFRLLVSDLPTNGNPGTADFDGDGIDNQTEVNLGSNPISLDSDRDGMPDAWEYLHGFSLTQPGAADNADSDALSNLGEYLVGTDPHTVDGNVAASVLLLEITSH